MFSVLQSPWRTLTGEKAILTLSPPSLVVLGEFLLGFCLFQSLTGEDRIPLPQACGPSRVLCKHNYSVSGCLVHLHDLSSARICPTDGECSQHRFSNITQGLSEHTPRRALLLPGCCSVSHSQPLAPRNNAVMSTTTESGLKLWNAHSFKVFSLYAYTLVSAWAYVCALWVPRSCEKHDVGAGKRTPSSERSERWSHLSSPWAIYFFTRDCRVWIDGAGRAPCSCHLSAEPLFKSGPSNRLLPFHLLHSMS